MVTIVNYLNKIFVLKLQQGVQAVSLNSYGPLTNNLGMCRQVRSYYSNQTKFVYIFQFIVTTSPSCSRRYEYPFWDTSSKFIQFVLC